VRIDRPDPSDGPGEAPVARRARSTPDEPDAASEDRGTAVSGDGPPDSFPAHPDAALRTERTVAYRAKVDAVYQQYAIDHSDARGETLERGTATPAVKRIDVQDPERHLVDLAGLRKGNSQPPETARRSPQVTDDTNAVTRDGSTPADHDGGMPNLGDSPPTAPGDDSIGNGGGTQSSAGDTPPDPEGDDPEGVNGGLGELVSVNAKDWAADLLAERIGGEASVRFTKGPPNEFDAVSSEYVAQAKPANFTLNQAFRNQAKATFEVSIQSGRTPYFQFDGPPGPGVLQTLSRYADRYGIEPVIDLTPQGEANA
jgi:Restriction endonuclease fold toxin 3